ncbi:hypothetical protein SUGI_0666160 [Cryptomeria japonica]|nr:hypothetical protein SUGI_0666160 [Cryptomeria japonica]
MRSIRTTGSTRISHIPSIKRVHCSKSTRISHLPSIKRGHCSKHDSRTIKRELATALLLGRRRTPGA